MDRRGALKDALAGCFKLLNVAALTTVATGGVYQSQAPQGTVLDYVVLESPTSEQWDSMQNPGEDITFNLAAVTLKPDAGAAMAILEVGIGLLDGKRPTVNANHLCIRCAWQRTKVMKDPDLVNGKTAWRAVATYAVLVDQVA